MNPLEKARDGAASAWRSSRDGTTRTARWIRDGATAPVKKLRWRLGELTTRSEDDGAAPAATAAPAESGEASGIARLVESARSNQRVAIAWAVVAMLVIAWIAWAVYVTAENGANAGLGVVISWPAVFAALALVASPFVAAWLLVHRHREGLPLLAGGESALAGDPGQGKDGDTDSKPAGEAGGEAAEGDSEEEGEEPESDASEDEEDEDDDEESEPEEDDSDEEDADSEDEDEEFEDEDDAPATKGEAGD